MNEEIQNNTQLQQVDSSKPLLRVWGPWQTLGLGLAIIAINGAAQVGVFFGFVFMGYMGNPSLDIIELMTNLATNGTFLSISVIAGATIGVPITIVFIKARRRASIREYLALEPLTWIQILASVGITVILMLLIGLVAALTGQPDETFTVSAYETAQPLALLWISFLIFAAAFEEILFRGFLFAGWVKSRIGAIGTVALTSVLFALIHLQYDLFGMMSVLVMGIALGAMRLKTGSLWSSLLMHFTWNLMGMITIALSQAGIGS